MKVPSSHQTFVLCCTENLSIIWHFNAMCYVQSICSKYAHGSRYWSIFMMTSSNGNIFRVTGHLCGEFTGHRWIPRANGQWRGTLMLSLICAWMNNWVNNREAGDLGRHRAHYNVAVMCCDLVPGNIPVFFRTILLAFGAIITLPQCR